MVVLISFSLIPMRHSSLELFRRPPPFALACALLFALAGFATAARATAYWSTIHAVVLAIDHHHRTLTIRHEALETEPAGIRTCGVRDPRALLHLHVGQLIEARAETSHAQWILDGIRVVGPSGASQQTLTSMALL
jgi:hypothetical protein